MSATGNNFESFSFVWLEKNANRLKTKFDTQNQFQNRLQTFDDENRCEHYIQKLPTNSRIILIVSDQFGNKLIPRVHRLQQISIIYVYGTNDDSKQEWIKDYNKVT